MEVGERSAKAQQRLGGERYRIAGPEVVHETVEGETIIVNLESGSYYDLNDSGACIFAAVREGGGLEEIVETVCEEFGVDDQSARADAESLLDELVAEQLIVSVARPDVPARPIRPAPAAAKRSYSRPRIGKYTDMQELLLLDPVHEVDDTGWPSSA